MVICGALSKTSRRSERGSGRGAHRQPRIFNGEDAEVGEFPFMVGVNFRRPIFAKFIVLNASIYMCIIMSLLSCYS